MPPQKKSQNAKQNITRPLSQEDQSQVQQQIETYRSLAQKLHQSEDEAQLQETLSPVFNTEEGAQLFFIEALATEYTSEAAEILSAIYACSPIKEVRKEARRALIRLEGARIYPQWEPPAQPKLSSLLEGALNDLNTPTRFWKGVVTDSKDIGEVQLMLYWEQGVDYKEVRTLGFLLEFSLSGVKDFLTDVESKRQSEKQLERVRQNTVGVKLIDCTLDQARHLLQEALAVNQRHGTKPSREYLRNLPLIQQLILDTDTTESEGTMTNSSFSGQDSFTITPDLQDLLTGTEAEDVAATFLDEWAKGHYGEVYDLLASTSPLLEGLSREGWIERRQEWRKQANPEEFRLGFLQQREEEETPNELAGPSEVEAAWSLEYSEASYTLPEIPLATVIYAETGRRWFWASVTIIEDKGELFVQDMIDEGARARQLTTEELDERIEEIAEQITVQAQTLEEEDEDSPDESEEDGEENLAESEDEEEDVEDEEFAELVDRVQETMRLTTIAMHYSDALIAQSPDKTRAYDLAFGQAEFIQEHERAAAYMQQMAEHLPEHRGEALRKLAIAFFSMSEAASASDDVEQALHYLARAEKTARDSLALETAPLGQILLAQTLVEQNKQLDEAEQLLKEAQKSSLGEREETLVMSSLGHLAQERDDKEQALQYYQRAAAISPDFPAVWFTIGHLQRELNRLDEAEESYLRSIKEEPELTDAYVDLAYLYAELQHNLAKARDILDEGLEITPDSAELLAAQAMVHIQSGDLRAAKEYLEEAEDIDPDLEFVKQVRRIYQSQRSQNQPGKKAKQHKRKK